MSIGSLQLRRPEASESCGVCGERQRPQRRERAHTEQTSGYRGRSTSELNVRTAEGDTITISLAAQVRYAESAKGAESSSSAQLQVSVKGDLSDAEFADLGKLLQGLGQAAESGGDTGFSQLTSLSAFSYRYEQTAEAGSYLRVRG